MARRNAALKHLYSNYFSMAQHIVISNKGDENDAADVFQDALITMYENVNNGTFRGESALKTYLYAIIRNYSVTRIKKNMKTTSLDHLADLPDDCRGFSLTELKDIESELLQTVLDSIGPGCKKLLSLYYYHGLSMKEITRQMSFSNEKSAKAQKYKCMQKLIALIEQKPGLKDRLSELHYHTNP